SEVKLNENLVFNNKSRFAEEFEKSKKLNGFNSKEEADDFVIKQKNELLDLFITFINKQGFFNPDFSPESLKELELLYFNLFDQNQFSEDLITREDFELYMSLYYGEVMVKNTVFEWG